MIALAEEIYRTRTVSDDGGNTFPLRGSIDEAEGKLITSVIAGDERISKTLEIGRTPRESTTSSRRLPPRDG